MHAPDRVGDHHFIRTNAQAVGVDPVPIDGRRSVGRAREVDGDGAGHGLRAIVEGRGDAKLGSVGVLNEDVRVVIAPGRIGDLNLVLTSGERVEVEVAVDVNGVGCGSAVEDRSNRSIVVTDARRHGDVGDDVRIPVKCVGAIGASGGVIDINRQVHPARVDFIESVAHFDG